MGTRISWTDETWNPVTGCSKVSAGCLNCYAERLSARFGWTQLPWTPANAKVNVQVHPDRLQIPYKWHDRRRVFVCSMSDLFHELVPAEFISAVLDVIRDTQHIYQVLTKRPERAVPFTTNWPENALLGVSVENADNLPRLEVLRSMNGVKHKFVSFEPLLGPIECNLAGIEWVIVGGESGRNYRRLDHAWVRTIRSEARRVGAAFFFKQDSAVRPETGAYVVEEDGTRTVVQEWPVSLARG